MEVGPIKSIIGGTSLRFRVQPKKVRYIVTRFVVERSKYLFALPPLKGECTILKRDFSFVWGRIDGCGTYLFLEEELKQEGDYEESNA